MQVRLSGLIAHPQVRWEDSAFHDRWLRQKPPVPTQNPVRNELIPAALIKSPSAQIVFEVRMSDVKVFFEREVEEFVGESRVVNVSRFTR